jgi:hypothetical protein
MRSAGTPAAFVLAILAMIFGSTFRNDPGLGGILGGGHGNSPAPVQTSPTPDPGQGLQFSTGFPFSIAPIVIPTFVAPTQPTVAAATPPQLPTSGNGSQNSGHGSR